MKNRKLNIDRAPIDSKEIQAGMNFTLLMGNYQAMSKPFYKTKWFFGTTGIASIGLIVGGSLAFQSSEESQALLDSQTQLITDAPPAIMEEPNAETSLVAFQDEISQTNDVAAEQISKSEKTDKHDKIVTSSQKSNTTVLNTTDNNDQDTDLSQPVQVSKSGKQTSDQTAFDPMDLTPRINGKLDGHITREDLMDNKGLTTNADVNIIHFELHLIDGLGGRVFEEESNQLTEEMKSAIGRVDQGETIYFENIKGKTSDGHIVRLNPLRYILLN